MGGSRLSVGFGFRHRAVQADAGLRLGFEELVRGRRDLNPEGLQYLISKATKPLRSEKSV